MSSTIAQQFLIIRKEACKFSAAHMTVYSGNNKERLHGHNFEVELKVELKEAGLLLPFSDLKNPMKAICDKWDEKVLLAKKNPHFKIIHQNLAEIEFTLCEDRYVLPTKDVEFLDCDNITTENLAMVYAKNILELNKSLQEKINSLEISIFEYSRQGACYKVSLS